MEWNDLLSEVNILICYTPETDLRMQSYDTMKLHKKYCEEREKSTG